MSLPSRRLVADWLWPLAAFALLAVVPWLNVSIPKLFDQPVSSPGTLALLGSCLLFGGLALTYDIQFGFTGMLSFGHALYIAIGVYLSNIAITDWHWRFWPAVFFTMGVAFVLANVLGFVSLRVGGIAFAMVTLAFAQAGSVLALKDPHHWTHGEEGLGADYTKLPKAFVGILNTKYLYWLALAFCGIVFFVVRWAVESSPGRVWQAVRENEQRVEVLGLRPPAYRLQAFVLSSLLAAAGGIVYMLLYNGSTLAVTQPNFTLTLLLMVVIGGAGSRWGAVLGGILYTYVNNRLIAIGSSSAVAGLPHGVRTPIEQPLFLLGAIFILIVIFLPGGLAGLARRGPSGLSRMRAALAGGTTAAGPQEGA
ncbi:MAG TPA: branched-chain amino acid ABC transporter permease [Gaiellaceae bacterium]|nr:branched-chain amino acid ABC transporter permease [Gaiellaceae bacterium]